MKDICVTINEPMHDHQEEGAVADAIATPQQTNLDHLQIEEHDETGQMEQYVVFKLGEEEYAAPILDVQEIIPAGDITPFPNAPEYIAGIINVRGTVATVLNLAQRFQLERPENGDADRYIILTKTEKALFGIQVDMVSSVIKIDQASLRSTTAATDTRIEAGFVKGVAVLEGRVILILDFHRILDNEQSMADDDAVATAN